MYTNENYRTFKEYLEDVEKLMPDVTPVEVKLLRRYYKKHITPYDAVHDMLKFIG